MKKILLIFIVIMVGGGSISCDNIRKKEKNSGVLNTSKTSVNPKYNPEIKYANGFQIKSYNGYRLIQILNPWKEGTVSSEYCVVDPNMQPPSNLSEECKVITLPLLL